MFALRRSRSAQADMLDLSLSLSGSVANDLGQEASAYLSETLPCSTTTLVRKVF